ncbi:MAG: hypothetical protein JO054_17815 [Actinobacteria bacterium]|nr:hypothetical protein [Actinomycetota bacterium]
MQSWRRYTILGLVAFLVGVAIWASMSWTDTINYDVPKGQAAPAPVKVDCGHLFGSRPSTATRVVPANTNYKLSHTPCDGRTSRQVLAIGDGVLGVVALIVLVTRFPARRPEVPATS